MRNCLGEREGDDQSGFTNGGTALSTSPVICFSASHLLPSLGASDFFEGSVCSQGLNPCLQIGGLSRGCDVIESCFTLASHSPSPGKSGIRVHNYLQSGLQAAMFTSLVAPPGLDPRKGGRIRNIRCSRSHPDPAAAPDRPRPLPGQTSTHPSARTHYAGLSFASANTLALPRSRFNCPCINRTQESSAGRHMMRTSPNHSHPAKTGG